MTRQGRETTDTAPRPRLGLAAGIVLVLAAVALTVVIGVVRTASSPVDTVERSEEVTATAPAPATAYVHVFGAVARPGLYRVDAGSRVVDVIAAAGGFTGDADPAGVNLARAVSDGEQLHVLRVGEPPARVAEPGAPGSGSSSSTPINLNTADGAALESLPRIGPALAERIIAWRDENGAFTSVDDLLAVPGIGEKMLAGLRERVTV